MGSDVPALAWPESGGFGRLLPACFSKSQAKPPLPGPAWLGPALAQAGAFRDFFSLPLGGLRFIQINSRCTHFLSLISSIQFLEQTDTRRPLKNFQEKQNRSIKF
jgi:hypothetical protein